MANHLAMAAILEPGDEVLMEQPVYGPILDAALYLEAEVRRFVRRPRRAGSGRSGRGAARDLGRRPG